MRKQTRRRFIGSTAALTATSAATGCLHGEGGQRAEEQYREDEEPETEEENSAAYEVWALDQGTDTGYIYIPDGDGGYVEGAVVDFDVLRDGHGHGDDHDEHDDDGHGHGELAPHMIDFNSTHEYAVVSVHHGNGVAVVDAEVREIVAEIETGRHSHFASFTPDDGALIVDHTGGNTIKKVDADLESLEFEVVDEITLTEEEGDGFDGRDPTCHYYTGTGYSYHTLGPSYHDSGLAVVDYDEFELVEAYTGDEVAANCGVFPHPSEEVVYLTAGLPSDPEQDVDGVGEYFVVDANTHEVLKNHDSGGVDAHGVWITPDGEELWITNRESNSLAVVDTTSHEVVEVVDNWGRAAGETPEDSDAPDILAVAPDGEHAFASLRGPNPVTADPQAATGVNPGFAVADVESREVVDVIQPEGDDADSDFHGIGVRPLDDHEGYVSPPW